MALIEVKHDPTLEQSEIIARLDNSSPAESGDQYTRNPVEIQQTSIYGVQCPIISVNNVMIAVEDIWDFELDDTKQVPSVSMCVYDRKSLIQYLDTPGNDNELRIQILPPFEDAYKKIDLTFFISNFRMGNHGELYINADYKLSAFTSSQFKSFGEVSLYELFDSVASETKLGFATNVENVDDKRFVYCPYNSYRSTIEKEVSHSGDEVTIYDWWIDVWNYLNLVNVYDRYNSVDAEDDMKVWISGMKDDSTESMTLIPQEVTAELTNLFGSDESQLYVNKYRINNDPGINVFLGTDKVYSIYSMKDLEYQDKLISDGDVKKDLFYNFEYKGEVYGEYDYITNGMMRTPFLQKMKNGSVEVDLTQPLLGLQRGGQCRFACYYNDDLVDYTLTGMKEEGLADLDPSIDVPMNELGGGSDTFKLDNSISGQYLIIGNKYKFKNGQWTHTVILTRPIERKPKLLAEE